MVAILLSIIIFQVKKLSGPSDEATEEKKMMVAALPWSILVVTAFISLQMIVKEDQVGRFMLTSLLLAGVQQTIPMYFILTLPKLKTFADALSIFKMNKVLPL